MRDIHSKPNQKGVTLIFVALWMGIALAGLMVLDIGNLFWQKREIQKIADLSALAGANTPIQTFCAVSERGVAQANGLLDAEYFLPVPGYWGANESGTGVQFKASNSSANACHVTVKRVVPYFFMWPASAGTGRELTAEATAVTKSRLARLSIRTQLAAINSQDSVLLNALIGGLLGGQLNVGVMGWQGLVDTDVSLLSYLQVLAIDLGLNVGNYDELLNTEVQLGSLISALVTAVGQDANTANVTLDALRAIQLKAGVSPIALRLSDLLKVQTGLPQEALRTDLNLLQLVQALVQVGNGHSALSGEISIPLPGVLNVTAYLKVIEPPMLSAIGDPELAKQQPQGPNEIFVRSAQTRVLLSVELPAVGALTTVVNTLTTVVSPLLSLVNVIFGGGGGLFDLEVLPTPVRIDVGVDVGAGHAYVTDYSCAAYDKAVQANVRTSVVDLRLGKWGATAEQAKINAFSSTSLAKLDPIAVARFDCIGCLQVAKRAPQYFGGLGLKLDLELLASKPDQRQWISPVPTLEEPVQWSNSSSLKGIVASLGPTILDLDALDALPAHPSASPAGIKGLVDVLLGSLKLLLNVVSGLITTILAPLLDPILDSLLKLLGVKLAGAEYGAQLNCGGGSELVY